MTLAPLAEPSLVTDQVFSALRDAIMSGEMAPGARLRLRDLAAQLGTSPMPVREAIGRLEQSGLVVRVPYRGAVVTDLTLPELVHIYDTRLLIEVEATRLGCAAAGLEELARMRRAYDQLRAAVAQGRLSEALDRDEELLSTLYAAGGNPVLLAIVQDLWQRCRAFKLLGLNGSGSLRPDEGVWVSQRQLIEAVADRDVAAAVAITTDSLTAALQRIQVLLSSRPERPAD